MIAAFGGLTPLESGIFHRSGLPLAAAGWASSRKDTATACGQSIVKVNLGNDGRLERNEAAVRDRAARRALKVERGDADLRGLRRPDGFEGEHEHFGVGRGRRRPVRDSDEDRAVRVDSVAEASRLFCAEIAA